MSVFAKMAIRYLEVNNIKKIRNIQTMDYFEENFETDFKSKVDKLYVFQHFNIGGEYLYNYFVIEDCLYYFNSDTDYWINQTDTYDIRPTKDGHKYNWIITKKGYREQRKKMVPICFSTPQNFLPSNLRKRK